MGLPGVESERPLYAGRRVTAREYRELEDDGYLYDMVDGVLHLSPSPLEPHSEALGRFVYFLYAYLDAHPGAGRVFPELDLFLPDEGDVLRPDIAFVSRERLAILDGQYMNGGPDLVVEFSSKSTAKRDRTVKADRYFAHGVREYWLPDPVKKSLHLWLWREQGWEKRSAPQLASEALPGLVIDAAKLFA